MTKPFIEKQTILPRIQGIQQDLECLYKYAKMPYKNFSEGPYFGDANFRLHRILEGMFNIGNHILSRIPGAVKDITTYRNIAEQLGNYKIVPQSYARDVFIKIAGYRNRLVHGYADIDPHETYKLIKHNLEDIEKYLSYIKKVLINPKQFGLMIK